MLLAIGIAVVATLEPAQASFPGKNGKIAFERIDFDWNVWDWTSEIYTVNADGSNQTTITAGLGAAVSNYWHFDPAWSPVGTKIAFGDRYMIHTMNADGSDLTRLTDWNYPTTAEHPAWPPDGTKIAYTNFSEVDDGSGDYRYIADIYIMSANGSNKTNITNGLEAGTYRVEPAWSPDGTKIVVSGISTMNLDDSNRTQITNNPEPDEQPSWQSLPAPPPPERCTITGTKGSNSLQSTSRKDVICGLGGDAIAGRGGDDILRGGPGDDGIQGGSGADKLIGEKGVDALDATDAVRRNDAMNGGGGTDACRGDRGDTGTGCEASQLRD
jgi:Ca2+-binding RTX toxin-like protein